MVHGRAVRRGSVSTGRDRVVGGGRVRPGAHGVVRRGVLNGRWEGPLHVGSLRMGEHARGAVATGGIVSAWDHASYFRRRQIAQASGVLVGWHVRRRSIVGDCTIGKNGRRDGHGWIIVGSGRGRVVAGSGRIDVAGIDRLLLRVSTIGLHRRALCHFAARRGE